MPRTFAVPQGTPKSVAIITPNHTLAKLNMYSCFFYSFLYVGVNPFWLPEDNKFDGFLPRFC